MQVQERHARLSVHKLLSVVLALAAANSAGTAVAAAAPPAGDVLFVGDAVTSSIFRFPVAGKGLAAGTVFVPGGPAAKPDPNGPNALNGPRGLVVVGGSLWVANQNAGRDFTGGINQYAPDGAFAAALVSAVPSPGANPDHAPFAPRGIVLWQDRLIVADLQGTGPPVAPDPLPDGDVEEYNTTTGSFIAVLPRPADVPFHPRGVVVGPDGALYVSNAPTLATSGIGGQVLRYASPGAAAEVVINCEPKLAASCRLNRPEGLVFGPDGTLYVTSFNNPADAKHTNDKILEYRGRDLTGQIDLDRLGDNKRTFAQALLFGPGGGLYVPITATGQIRRYDVTHPANPETVAPASALRPFYLTFGRTDPGTLAYGG
jgi:hypothetical protein